MNGLGFFAIPRPEIVGIKNTRIRISCISRLYLEVHEWERKAKSFPEQFLIINHSLLLSAGMWASPSRASRRNIEGVHKQQKIKATSTSLQAGAQMQDTDSLCLPRGSVNPTAFRKGTRWMLRNTEYVDIVQDRCS